MRLLVNRARCIIAFIIMLSTGIDIAQNLLERLNIDRNYLLNTGRDRGSGLIAHRNLFSTVVIPASTQSTCPWVGPSSPRRYSAPAAAGRSSTSAE